MFDHGLLYLARFHAEETRVADALRARRALPTDEGRAPLPGTGDPDPAQDAAVAAALRHRTTVITGGPGTGKTTTVVRVLNSLGAEQPVSIALAAQTGKAARQLHDAVVPRLRPGTSTQVPQASTLHRLLGLPVRGPRVQHDRTNPLPHDVVVVDEVSMVSLEHMAALLDAVSDHTSCARSRRERSSPMSSRPRPCCARAASSSCAPTTAAPTTSAPSRPPSTPATRHAPWP